MNTNITNMGDGSRSKYLLLITMFSPTYEAYQAYTVEKPKQQ